MTLNYFFVPRSTIPLEDQDGLSWETAFGFFPTGSTADGEDIVLNLRAGVFQVLNTNRDGSKRTEPFRFSAVNGGSVTIRGCFSPSLTGTSANANSRNFFTDMTYLDMSRAYDNNGFGCIVTNSSPSGRIEIDGLEIRDTLAWSCGLDAYA